jgi:hypothetical protein
MYSDDFMCAGVFNFRQQVGLSSITIRVGQEELRVTIEVFPSKLDYERDYVALLSAVASAARGLALEYLRATYRRGSVESADKPSNLEWLTLLRNELNILDRAVRYVNDHPFRVLLRRTGDIATQDIKRIDASIRKAIIRGRGTGPWISVPEIGRVRSVLPATKTGETLDTPEHRWMRLSLSTIRDRLVGLHSSITSEVQSRERVGLVVSKRLEAERREVSEFVDVIERLLALPVFAAVQGLPPSGFASLTLLSQTGYAEAYRAITVVQLGLNVEGNLFDLSVSDVHDLYEAWCFIQLVRMVVAMDVATVDSANLLQIEESGIRVRLRRGERSSISLESIARKVTISYNHQYPGLTGAQRPDIVLRIEHANWPSLIVVLDAKYRIDGSERYRNEFGTAGPPQDAVNALHRYRDAIVVESAQRGIERPVVKGAALFPLSADESIGFATSRLFRALEALGIGALPFLPGNTEHVAIWLNSLLTLPPEALADPGPPFIGLLEKQRRALRDAEAL